jgi:plasmid stabilization system protein ParE
MAFRIDWTEVALSDLQETVRFIAGDNPQAAKRFGNLIVERIEGISTLPFSARMVPEKNDENIREIILRPYRLVLEIDSVRQVVHVLRIWHSSRGTPEIR